MLLFLQLLKLEDPLLDIRPLPSIQLVPVDLRVLATDRLGRKPTYWVVHMPLWFVKHFINL
jgi:hypothetical protein